MLYPDQKYSQPYLLLENAVHKYSQRTPKKPQKKAKLFLGFPETSQKALKINSLDQIARYIADLRANSHVANCRKYNVI